MKKVFLYSFFALFGFFSISVSCSQKTNDKGGDEITLNGSFSSTKGVMKRISCFCYDSGYLTIENGDRIPVCFKNEDSNKLDKSCLENVTFTGKYEVVKKESDSNSPCAGGEMKIFMVSSFKCKKNDNLQSDITIKGSFESKKGVMAGISCYCYDSGYLTLENGDKVAVCFGDENSDELKCTENVVLTGKYVTETSEENPNSPCPAGEMKLFKVSSFKCE